MADLITLAQYKIYNKITGSGDDSLNTELIASASAAIEKLVGRTLTSASYTEDYSPRYPGKLLQLNNYPVTALTQVRLWPNETYVETYDSGNFNIDLDRGLVEWATGSGRGTWPRGFQVIEVSYTGGYSTVPDDLQLATALFGNSLFNMVGSDVSITSESLETYSVSFSAQVRQEMLSGAKGSLIGSLLAPYVKLRVA